MHSFVRACRQLKMQKFAPTTPYFVAVWYKQSLTDEFILGISALSRLDVMAYRAMPC